MMTEEERRARASAGGHAVVAKYGVAYMRALGRANGRKGGRPRLIQLGDPLLGSEKVDRRPEGKRRPAVLTPVQEVLNQ